MYKNDTYSGWLDLMTSAGVCPTVMYVSQEKKTWTHD